MPDTAADLSADISPTAVLSSDSRYMVPWHALHRSPLNPRRHFGESLDTLAESIAANGVMQNLTVRRHPTIAGEYEIVSGESRHRAVEILIKAGRAAEDYRMPVLVQDLDDTAVLEIAMAENMARKDLTPMEEARGLAELKKRGVSTAQMAARLGCTQRHVQLRLKLVEGLTGEAQQALEDGKINVETARVIATAPVDKQKKLLTDVQRNPWQYRNADALRREINKVLIPENAAKFDIALYTGGWIEPDARDFRAEWRAKWDADENLRASYDTFEEYATDMAEDVADEIAIAGQRCFADVGQFMKLQKAEARRIADDLGAKGAAWFEIKTGAFFREHDYEKKKGHKAAGVVIFINAHGALTIHRDLVKRAQGGNTTAAAAAVEKPKGPRIEEEFPRVIFEQAAIAKYRLVQRAVAADPYHALRILCADILLDGSGTLALDARVPDSGIDADLRGQVQALLKKMPSVGKGLKIGEDGITGGTTDKEDIARLEALFDAPDDKVLKLAGLLIAMLIGESEWNLGRSHGDTADIVAIAGKLKIKGDEVKHGLGLTMEQLEDVGDAGIRGIARDLKIESWMLSTRATLLEKIRECVKRGSAKNYVLPPYRFTADATPQLAALIKDTDGAATPEPTVEVGGKKVPRAKLAEHDAKATATKPAAKKPAKKKAAPKAKAKKGKN